MSFQPWKPLLLTALAVGAGATAATAQTVAAAQHAIELGRYNEARASLRGNATAEGNYELGRLYQMREMADSAQIYFSKAGGGTPMGLVAEGRALLAKGKTNFAAADAKFDAAAKAGKNKDPKVLTAIAQAYAESDITDKAAITRALTYVEAAQLANKGKDDPALLVARGDIYLKQGNGDGGGEAGASYGRALLANPNSPLANERQGSLNIRSRNASAAITDLNKAISLDPKYAPAYYDLAGMYAKGGQYDKALDNYRLYAAASENSPRLTQQYAAFLYLSKKYPESLAEANKALATDPNNLTMNRLKAYTSFETGDYTTAGTAMDQLMKLAPADKLVSDDYSYQARILMQAKRYDEASAVLEKAIAAATDPDKKTELTDTLISVYTAKKDYASAIRLIRQNTNPDLATQYRLGSAYIGNKQFAKADSVFNIITTTKATYAPGWQARAQANYGLDPDSKQGLAKPYYEKYLEVTAADPTRYSRGITEANRYLGYYNLQQGKKADAQTYYQKILDVDPADVNATEAMKVIKGVPAPKLAPKVTPKKK
ncbi:MAG: tetratricopeptide repeat protein [Janthinobacterium lividum]